VEHHRHYGPALPAANWVPAPRYLLRRDLVFRRLAEVPPCRVLDIGCGPAVLLSELAARGFEATGVDDARPALALARSFAGRDRPMTLTHALDPAWRGRFDLLLSFEVIEHLEEDVAAMADWIGYLRPGGRLMLSTPAHPSRWNAADVWAGHVRRYTRAGLRSAVERAGFEIERIDCYGFPVANWMEHLRARTYAKAMEGEAKRGKSESAFTADSGTDRTVESRFWRLFASMPASMAMRAAMRAQLPFLSTDLGNGYLVTARRPG
jgi:SAM-dependent methyltransferase